MSFESFEVMLNKSGWWLVKPTTHISRAVHFEKKIQKIKKNNYNLKFIYD